MASLVCNQNSIPLGQHTLKYQVFTTPEAWAMMSVPGKSDGGGGWGEYATGSVTMGFLHLQNA